MFALFLTNTQQKVNLLKRRFLSLIKMLTMSKPFSDRKLMCTTNSWLSSSSLPNWMYWPSWCSFTYNPICEHSMLPVDIDSRLFESRFWVGCVEIQFFFIITFMDAIAVYQSDTLHVLWFGDCAIQRYFRFQVLPLRWESDQFVPFCRILNLNCYTNYLLVNTIKVWNN